MNSTRHELVEEMYDALSRFAGHIARYQASEDRHAQHECTMAHAHAFVDSTLKAVVDGMPLPGEVGRAKGYADTKGYDSGFRGQADVELIIDEHNVPKRGIYDGDRLEFIALSPTSHREEE